MNGSKTPAIRRALGLARADIAAGLALRRLRQQVVGGFHPHEIERARTAWGNLGWSATTDLVSACIQALTWSKGAVLECGSGFTTAVLGIALEKSGRQYFALEHDPSWAMQTRRRLSIAGIRNVSVLRRKLASREYWDWYAITQSDLPERIGLVICDGPPGRTRGGRSGMLPCLRDAITSDTVIVVDDVDRPQELELAHTWAEELGLPLEVSPPSSRTRRQFAVIGVAASR